MSGSSAPQLAALLRLRWRMMRSPHQRRGAILSAGLLVALVGATILGPQLAPYSDQVRFNLALLWPTTLASFLVLAVISPASSAGGTELFPSDQLVAFPVRDRTIFASTVLLAPANLAWIAHFLALLGLTSYLIDPGRYFALPFLTMVAYAFTATLVGQALAWWFEGIRQQRAGRLALRILALSGTVALVVMHATDRLTPWLDRLPTRQLTLSAAGGAQGKLAAWVAGMAVLALIATVAAAAGVRACSWSVGRATDGGMQPETRPVKRRASARRDLTALMQIDRASVWRSAPLRRGAFVMAALPGGIAAIAAPDWASLVLLTGLVAAGSGLLFGVNAFGVDGPGALTLEGLPVRAELRFWSKTAVILEFCALTVAGALLVGSLRSPESPTGAQLAAIMTAVVATSLAVAAFCLRVSIRAPYRSDLRGRRDTPAPPGAMVSYSARLAWRTTWISMILSLFALSSWWWLPLLAGLPMVCLAAASLARSLTMWQSEATRAQVVATVASG